MSILENIFFSYRCENFPHELAKLSNIAEESNEQFGNHAKLQRSERYTGEQPGTDRTRWPLFGFRRNLACDMSNDALLPAEFDEKTRYRLKSSSKLVKKSEMRKQVSPKSFEQQVG